MRGTTAVIVLTLLQSAFAYHLHFLVPLKYNLGNSYAHALTIAIDDVNNDPKILPGHNLTYSWSESSDDDVMLQTMYGVASNHQKSIDVFIGPASNCQAPVQVAEKLKIPMISYDCSEEDEFTKQKYPLFVQTYSNTNSQAAGALLALLKRQNWTRIGILYEEDVKYWQRLTNITINSPAVEVAAIYQVPGVNKFNRYGENFLEFKELRQRNESLAKVRKILTTMAHEDEIQVFVLFTSFDILVEIMAEAYSLGLTGYGRRAFIGFQLDAKILRKNYVQYPEMFYSPRTVPALDIMYRAKRAAKSLLIVAATQPVNTDRYERFRKELVNRTENEGPFKDATVYDVATGQTEISEVACALYDAVYQYALALDRLRKRNANITAANVVKEFRTTSYESMSGYTSEFLQKGVLKAHLSLLYLADDVTQKNFQDVHMKPIGSFNYAQNSTLYLAMNDSHIQLPMLENVFNHSAAESLLSSNTGPIQIPGLFWLACVCIALQY